MQHCLYNRKRLRKTVNIYIYLFYIYKKENSNAHFKISKAWGSVVSPGVHKKIWVVLYC